MAHNVHNDKMTSKLLKQNPLEVLNQNNVTVDDADDSPHVKGDNRGFLRGNNEDDNFPGIFLRATPEGDNDKTKTKEPNNIAEKPPNPINIPAGLFPPPPSVGIDIDAEIIPTQIIPDVNVYQHKKTLAQGMMDLALFSANANQLRYVLESFSGNPYYYPSIVLISFSLLMQVAVGVGLVWNAIYNVKNEKEICIANKINNFTVIGIFLVTVINVFISAFGVATAAPVT